MDGEQYRFCSGVSGVEEKVKGSGLRVLLESTQADYGFGVCDTTALYWVGVKELNLSYYIGGTILITIYTHYGNLF